MTLYSDQGLMLRPLQIDEYTARRLVAAVIVQAVEDVRRMEKRLRADPQAKTKACERDAAAWLDSESTAPFSYRWCCGVLGVQPKHAPSPTPG
ncbi:MAG TPA: hypothetical protein VFH59_17750 [Frateuria sp.]|uniref:hypothetical protein n=1 Tax=Frateuria sp. TaxID=2211372 RepID=UPI002D81017C|nr:hypothetical protein [Frateuria sp.]HET6807283.1 hypothetical protein [Frateuria sp.]